MNQPGPAFSPPWEKDEAVYPFINYLWEAFFLPKHLILLAGMATLATLIVLFCVQVELGFPAEWMIPLLLGGIAVVEWKLLQRWSQQPAFIQAINHKYQAEIRVFRDEQHIPRPTLGQYPDLSEGIPQTEN